MIRSGLHLVTYLDVGNFCDNFKHRNNFIGNLYAIFSKISRFQQAKPSVSLFYELA